MGFFSKACEMFISELTLCGWCHRRTLSPSDITEAAYFTNTYDFLVNVIPWDRDLELKIALNGSVLTTGNNSYNIGDGTETGIGNFRVDMGGTGFVGMRYHYIPVESKSILPLWERGLGEA